MAFAQIFNVATQFRFEIGSAMLGTKALTSQVEKLSDAADDVTVAFKRIGFGVMANLGLGVGGMLGLVMKSSAAYEHLQHAQLNFANSITAMGDKITGPVKTFNEKMIFSKYLLGELAKKAREFALPQNVMVGMAEQLMPALGAKGLLGKNMENLVEFTRNMLKAAPAMGVSPDLAQQQSLMMMTGGANMQQTFFQRLTFDTEAMSKFKNKAKEFNQLKAHEKFDLILKGLQQFTKDADVLSGRVELIGSQFQILRDTLTGAMGILLPIGEKINAMVVPVLKRLDMDLHTFGREILNNFVKFFEITVGGLENLIKHALTLRRLSGDISKAGKTLGVLGILKILGGFALMAKIIKFMWKPIIGLVTGFGAVIAKLGIFAKGVAILGFFLNYLILPLALVVMFFQSISRAMAIAKIADARALPPILAKMSEQMVRLGKVGTYLMKPFNAIMDWFANLISPIFRVSLLMKILSGAFELLLFPLELIVAGFKEIGNTFVLIKSAIAGMWKTIKDFLGITAAGEWLSGIGDIMKTMFSAMVGTVKWGLMQIHFGFSAFISGLILMVDNAIHFRKLTTGLSEMTTMGKRDIEKAWGYGDDSEDVNNRATTENNTYIHKVDVINKFKDNMHPDRIAFTIVDQLGKVGRNKVRSAGGTSLSHASMVGVN